MAPSATPAQTSATEAVSRIPPRTSFGGCICITAIKTGRSLSSHSTYGVRATASASSCVMKREYAESKKRPRRRDEVPPPIVRDYAKLKADLEHAQELADMTLKTYRRELQR